MHSRKLSGGIDIDGGGGGRESALSPLQGVVPKFGEEEEEDDDTGAGLGRAPPGRLGAGAGGAVIVAEAWSS